jgi:ATP-binding cassette subfamily B protein
MSDEQDDGPAAWRPVLGFMWGHWRRTPWLTAAVAGFRLAATLTEVLVPVAAGVLVDALVAGDAARAWQAFAAMIGLGVLMILFRALSLHALLPFTTGQMRAIAAEAFGQVQRLSSDWHANSFAGSTVRKISRGMWAVDTVNDLVLIMLLPGFGVLLGTVVVMALEWPVLGAAMGVGAALFLGLTVAVATRWLAPAARLSNRWDTKVGGVLADSIGANAVVKAFAGEDREAANLGRVLAKWRRRTLRTWRRFVWNDLAMLSLLWGLRAVVTAGAIALWAAGEASVGGVAYVLTAYLVLHGYLRDMGHQVQDLQRAINEMEELVQLHAEPVAVADRPGAVPARIAAGAIRFERVGFRHQGQATPLFEGLDVAIRAGERVGLVGRSGSGKSTFVKLVQRLHDVTDGRVLIDGRDVRAVTQASLRRAIAIVPQEPILFHRSIAENIGYARPGAGMAAIERAAVLANAHDFIARLPKGYRTLVGERGVKLSGGERQRVALARAFLADAPILVLDEATSSLDSESEALIQRAMGALLAGRTALVIAHRLSTVQAMDRILLFDHGRIVEEGTHAALLAMPDGGYRRLFERQSSEAAPVIA